MTTTEADHGRESGLLTVNVEADFDQERLGRAISSLEHALELDAENVRYRKVYAEALLAARRFNDAVDHLLLVYRSRSEPRVAYLIAYAYYRLNHLPSAERYLDEVVSDTNVGFSRLHVLRGRILYEKRLYAEAVNEFSRALIINPDSPLPKWHMGRALVAHAAQLAEDTANLYRRALKLVTEYSPIQEELDEWHRTLGRIHIALHHPLEALRHLEEVKNVPGNDKTLLLGLALLLSGSLDPAASALAEAAADPETRPRCAEYLLEIVTTPAANLAASAGSTNLDPGRVDKVYLERIFGEGAAEVHSIMYAAESPRRHEAARTRVELCSPLVSGRLFAGEGLGKPGTGEAPPAADSEQTTEDVSVESIDDTLKPQTMLDVTSELPDDGDDTEETAVADGGRDTAFSDEDWDIGFVPAPEEEVTDGGPAHDVPKTQRLDVADVDGDEEEPS